MIVVFRLSPEYVRNCMKFVQRLDEIVFTCRACPLSLYGYPVVYVLTDSWPLKQNRLTNRSMSYHGT